jgi:hypothetical protein
MAVLSGSRTQDFTLQVVIFNMKSMEGRSQFVASLCVRTLPSYHASRATAWESFESLHLGKQVSHMEPASASYDGLDMLM